MATPSPERKNRRGKDGDENSPAPKVRVIASGAHTPEENLESNCPLKNTDQIGRYYQHS